MKFKQLINEWQNLMPSGENINTPSMHMRIYTTGIEMNLGYIGCISMHNEVGMTEFRQPLQVQSHLEMPGILVQLGDIQRT